MLEIKQQLIDKNNVSYNKSNKTTILKVENF